MVLIDSGTSHNFISTKLVKELGLGVEETSPIKCAWEMATRRSQADVVGMF